MERNNEIVTHAMDYNLTLTKFSKRKDSYQFRNDLIIKIDEIGPDEKAVKDHEEKLEKMLDDF